MVLSSIAIIIFAFIYTSFVVDPDHAADSLKKIWRRDPGGRAWRADRGAYRPGHVVYHGVGADLSGGGISAPEALLAYSNVPYYFGGASALIVVCTVLDIESQVRGKSLTGPGGEYS